MSCPEAYTFIFNTNNAIKYYNAFRARSKVNLLPCRCYVYKESNKMGNCKKYSGPHRLIEMSGQF